MKSIKVKLVLIVIVLAVISGGALVAGMTVAYQRNVAMFTDYVENPQSGEASVTDQLYEDAAGNRNRAMGLAIGLAVLQAITLVVCLNMFVFKRIDLVIHDTTRFIGGEIDTPIPVRNDDEIGRIEGALEEFRGLLVDTMKQVPSKD